MYYVSNFTGFSSLPIHYTWISRRSKKANAYKLHLQGIFCVKYSTTEKAILIFMIGPTVCIVTVFEMKNVKMLRTYELGPSYF